MIFIRAKPVPKPISPDRYAQVLINKGKLPLSPAAISALASANLPVIPPSLARKLTRAILASYGFTPSEYSIQLEWYVVMGKTKFPLL
jgi:hypothetical protein